MENVDLVDLDKSINSSFLSGNIFLFNNDEFKSLDRSEVFNYEIQYLQGGFVAAEIRDKKVRLRTDLYGIRELYLYKNQDQFIVSSSLPDIISILKHNDIQLNINYSIVKEVFTYFNQLSLDSPIKELKRISACDVEIDLYDLKRNFKKHDHSLISEISDKSPLQLINDFFDHLNDKISLALSGGLDSRFLLSILYNRNGDFNTISFGHPEHKDRIYAEKISSQLNIEHIPFYDVLNHKKEQNRLRSYLINNRFENDFSVFQLFKYYPKINNLVIDGCNLAALRNSYFTKLKLFGRDQWKRTDVNSLQEYFVNKKHNIFSDNIYYLNDELINDLFNYSENKSLNNWITEISFRIKSSNFFGNEQRDIDKYANSISPFLFPVMAGSIIKSNDLKKNGYKLMRDTIKKFTPELTKIDLVKSGVLAKFNSSMISSKLKMQLSKKTRSIQNELIINDTMSQVNELLENCYENSKKTGLYSDEMNKEIELHLQNKKTKLPMIDRFLAFEIYRNLIEDSDEIL